MKRRLAQRVNEEGRISKNCVENYNQLQSTREIIPQTLSRDDIYRIAECLMNTHGYNFREQFKLIDDLHQLTQLVNELKYTNVAENLIFIIYKKCEKHWVTFCIRKIKSNGLGDKVTILYKDSLGEAITPEIKQIIKPCFVEISVEFKSQISKDQIVENSSIPMSLKNMEIILKELKRDKLVFIENFEKTNFCSQAEAQQARKEFETLQEKLLQTLVSDLTEDEEYGNFKSVMTEFFDTFLKYTSMYKPLKEYSELIIDEANKCEKDANYQSKNTEINAVRERIFNGNFLEEILTKQTEMCRQMMEKGEGYDAIDKFSSQKKKFIKLLTNIKFNEKYQEQLQEISQKMDIDYNKIKKFFDVLKEQAEKTNQEEKVEPIIPKTIDFISNEVLSHKQKQNITPDDDVKSLEQLLSELELGVQKNISSNSPNMEADEDEILELSPEELKGHYKQKYKNNKQILELEVNYSKVKICYQQWKDKNFKDIFKWAKEKKGHLKTAELYEAIAIMDRANELVTKGHRLRDPQILSVLSFSHSEEARGKLYQVHTGEGKTIIVSLLATLKVLQGYKVDVITSNQVLAREGVQNRENFYGLFGISVSDNNAEECYEIGPRKCYTSDVLYGTMGNFQFDYLKDLFENFGTRANRSFGFAILDEVDSMTIDHGSYIAKLAGAFPGMDSLKYVYIKIWQELYKAEQHVYEDLKEKLKKKAEELSCLNLSEEEIQDKHEKYQLELFENLTDQIKIKIKQSEPANIEIIPSHLKQYAKDMLDKWIDNALYAKYQCEENEQYVIKQKDDEDVVVPVDYQNTGVTLKNTIWSHGLHQFVQLKHNLHVTSESLTSSSISNIGYIKLYNNKIFGLTGTLGSVAEQDLLSTIYNIDYARIPTYKEKNFEEIEGVVVTNDQWANLIALVSLLLVRQERSVLIICLTIRDLQELEKDIESLKKLEGFNDLKIKTYSDEDSSKVVKEEVGTSEIIIATNIAGRGTDFKTTSELEEKGGLHVCVSFLPVNQRVEDQAFGRTSRQGNCGTAQLIIKESDVLEHDIKIVPKMSFSVIKEKRDEVEKLRLENIKNEKLNEIDFQDSIVNKFANLYRKFKKAQTKESGGLFLAEDLKEFWAFWLQKKNFEGKDLTKEIEEKEFENFIRDARAILGNKVGDTFLGGKISHNFYYSIKQAEYFLNNDEVDKAEVALYDAIALSKTPELYSAYLKLFEVAIEKGGQMKERFKKALKKVALLNLFMDVEKDEAYKDNAIYALEKAKSALEKEINYIEKYFIGESSTINSEITNYDETTNENSITKNNNENKISNTDFKNILTNNKDNLLVKHVISRLVTLNTFHQHVGSLIKQIKDSRTDTTKGLVIGSRIPNYLKELDPNKESEKQLKEAITSAEISELGLVGLETIYALREVHDVHEKVIARAQVQIAAGLAALSGGVLFPPSMLVMGQIAGTLIAEGICDIVIELISRGDSTFNETAYIKGKCISYGITLATMGLHAIFTSTRILNRAVKACKSLASMLRRCPFLKTVCEILASQIDKLGKYFETLKLAAELNKLSKIGQVALSRTSVLMSGLKSIGKVTIQGVVVSVISEKLVTRGLQKILQGLKPIIKEEVKKAVNDQIGKEKLKLIKKEDLHVLICEIITGSYGEITGDVLKEVVFGVLRHSTSWKAKVTSIALDTVISTYKIRTYAEKFCQILNKQLSNTHKGAKTVNNDEAVNDIIQLTITLVTEHIYGLIVHLTGKYAHTFAVGPIMSKIWSLGKNIKKKKTGSGITKTTNFSDDETQDMHSFSDILDAFKTLALGPEASKEEINAAYKKLALKYHPDRHTAEASNELMSKINNARTLLISHLGNANSRRGANYNHPEHTQDASNANNQTINTQNVNNSNDSFGQAHRGNIETLSKQQQQHIIIKNNNGKTIEEFGKKFKGNPPVVLNYSPATEAVSGHYSVPDGIAKRHNIKIIPTGKNNCFYDAYAAIKRIQGVNLSPQQLRTIAENPNFTNILYNVIIEGSEILNNSITKNMFLTIQKYLLVGGDKCFEIYYDTPTDKTNFLERYQVRSKKTPKICGGSYKQLKKEFLNRRENKIELNHIPPKISYKGTKYAGISDEDKPVLAMERKHHRNCTSTGSSGISKLWQKEVNIYMGEFAQALIRDLIDVLGTNINIDRDYYKIGIMDLLDYCRDATIKGAPNGKLITGEEHAAICKILKLTPNEE